MEIGGRYASVEGEKQNLRFEEGTEINGKGSGFNLILCTNANP
jgi:hypothetical protein